MFSVKPPKEYLDQWKKFPVLTKSKYFIDQLKLTEKKLLKDNQLATIDKSLYPPAVYGFDLSVA